MAPDEPPDPRELDAAPIDVDPATPSELGRGVSRDVVVYTVGAVLANGVLYLAVPLYTRIFPPAEYSKVAFVSTLSGLLAGVLVLGGDTALARFWFRDDDDAARRRLCVTWIGFLAAWAVVVCVLLAPLTPWAASWALDDRGSTDLFLLALATLPVAQSGRMVAQVMRNQFRPVPFVATGLLLGVASLLLGVVFAVALDMGVAGIFVGILCAETVALVVRMSMTRSMFAGRVDRALLGELLRFGVPLVPVTVSFWVFSAADRVVVGKVAGLTQLGYYSVAVTVSLVFVVLTSAVSQAWLPRALQLYETDREHAATAVGTSLTYYLFGLGVLASVISALAPEVVTVLAGPEYSPAAAAIPLLCIGSVAYGSQTITASGMTVTHRTGLLAGLSVVAALVNVVAAVLLVPPFGISGAAGAGLIGYLFLTTAYLWFSQRLWPITLEHRRLIVVVALLAAVSVVTTVGSGAPLAGRLAVPVAFVVLCVVAAGTRVEERAALARLGSRIGIRR